MAEVEADWWMTDVIGPILAEGGTPTEIMQRTGRFSDEFSAVEDQLVLGLYHGQQAHAWMKNIFEGFEAALASRACTPTSIGRPRSPSWTSAATRASPRNAATRRPATWPRRFAA